MRTSKEIYPIERIISALSYCTVGGFGFIWLLVAAILKKNVTPFVMYHVLQSIFISMLYFLVVKLAEFVYIILYRIPVINAIPYYVNMPIPLLLNFSILQLFTTSVIVYLVVTSIMGKYSYLPWVSDIININTGRK